MKSDLQISQTKKLRDITSIAKKINLKSTDLTTFGKHIAKINSIPNRKKKRKTYSSDCHESNPSR
jgi:formate--tetrahydrofolate ligase